MEKSNFSLTKHQVEENLQESETMPIFTPRRAFYLLPFCVTLLRLQTSNGNNGLVLTDA